MPKSFAHAALDAAFAYVADRADRLVLCHGAPDSYAAAAQPPAAKGRALGSIEMSRGLGRGDYAVADGETSGRRLVVSRQDGVLIAETGVADHVALIDTNDQALLLVTALSEPVSVAAGGVVAVESFDDEIGDPV